MMKPLVDGVAIARKPDYFSDQNTTVYLVMLRMTAFIVQAGMTVLATYVLFYSADDTSTASTRRQLKETGILLSGLLTREVRDLLSDDDVQSFVADVKQDPNGVFQDWITFLER